MSRSVVVVLVMSCRHSPDDKTQGTTAQIARAVEMTRLSSNHDKRAWLNRLRQLTCPSDDVCQLRDNCVKAYDGHLSALATIEQAQLDMGVPSDSGDVPDASPESLLKAVSLAQTAQRQLAQARRLMQACAENEAVIRQRYGLH